MANPYVGQIIMFAGNFAPLGWALCNGQLLSIAENEVLFNLIGTTFGGDGTSTFALPDLQGRMPVHMGTSTTGSSYIMGEKTGAETVTLTVGELPQHSHGAKGSPAGNVVSPAGHFWSTDPGGNTAAYTSANDATMAADAIGSHTAAQPHDNMKPFVAVNYVISLFGIFPSQN
jgi:microcystin-dependent protein